MAPARLVEIIPESHSRQSAHRHPSWSDVAGALVRSLGRYGSRSRWRAGRGQPERGAYTLLPRSEYVYNPPNTVFNEAAPVGKIPDLIQARTRGPEPIWGDRILAPGGPRWLISRRSRNQAIRSTFDLIGARRVQWRGRGYIDNIRVFQCPSLEVPVLTAGPDYENPDTDGAYTLNWTRPNGATGPDLLQVSQTSCAPLIFDNAENGLANWTTTTSGTGAQPWTTGTKPQHDSTTFFAQGLPGLRAQIHS